MPLLHILQTNMLFLNNNIFYPSLLCISLSLHISGALVWITFFFSLLQNNNNLAFFSPLSNIRCFLFWVSIFKSSYLLNWIMIIILFWLLFIPLLSIFVLPTFRIKFKCLLMFYEDLILPLVTFLTSIPPTFSPADFAPATLAPFLLQCTFPCSVFCACCVSASGSAPHIFVKQVSSFHPGFCSCTTSLWRLFCAE